MSDDQKKPQKAEDEISNVDLQFMGQTDEKRELNATVKAESQLDTNPSKLGMDKQDVTVAQSMDASDPPSTNMGEDEK